MPQGSTTKRERRKPSPELPAGGRHKGHHGNSGRSAPSAKTRAKPPALNADSTYPEITFEGGTDAFFRRFWTIGTEWLCAWTPDGWFAAPGLRKAPPELLADPAADLDTDPRWLALNRQAAAFQTPLPLATVSDQYAATSEGKTIPSKAAKSPPP